MFSFFDGWKRQIVDHLSAFLTSQQEGLASVNRFGQEAATRLLDFALQGKMIRGGLTCLGHSLFQDRVTRDVLAAAGAMELIQSALLVHDDIMDRDSTRRGNPSMHRQLAELAAREGVADTDRVGESLGICIGDVAFFLAFELLGEIRAHPGVLRRVLRITGQELTYVGVAQMEDVYRGASAEVPSHEDTLRLYLYKTGRYTFSLPLVLGGLLAEGEDRSLEKLEAIGEDLGVIFQIKDDELGLFGSTESVGKPVGSDIREGKKTLFYSHLMAEAPDEERDRLASIFGNPGIGPQDVEFVRKLIGRLGIKKRVAEQLQFHAERVRGRIDRLQGVHEAYRSVLYELLDYSLSREK